MNKKTSAHIYNTVKSTCFNIITIFPFILNLYKFIQNKIHSINPFGKLQHHTHFQCSCHPFSFFEIGIILSRLKIQGLQK